MCFSPSPCCILYAQRVSVLSRVQFFETPWTVACQAPLSMGILQARILEWVTIPFYRGSFWPRDWTCISCIACRFFTIWAYRVLRRARYKSSHVSSDECEMEWEVPTALYDEASPGHHPLTLQTVLFIFLNRQDWDCVFPHTGIWCTV